MPLPITLYNDYLQKEFTLLPEHTIEENKLKIYCCGPTIYSYQQIGNMRAAFVPTVLRDLAELAGWNPELAINITDVGHLTGDNLGDADSGEDRMEQAAKKESKTAEEIADFYLRDYHKQLDALNIFIPTGVFNPKATEYLVEQAVLALTLLSKQQAYLLPDGIYFDSNQNVEALAVLNTFAGLPKSSGNNDFTDREIANTTKNPGDFALWKFVDDNNLQKWRIKDFVSIKSTVETDEITTLLSICREHLDEESFFKLQDSWGCPGWHTECVAMIARIMGRKNIRRRANFNFDDFQGKTTLDLHLGGIEHLPLHHKNEILQAEALGFTLSENWLHWQHVLVDGKKMGKSLGNSYLVTGNAEVTGFESIVEKGYDPLAYRLMLFEHHYSQPLDFTWDKLAQAQTRLFNMRKEKAKIYSFYEAFQFGNFNKDKFESSKAQIIAPGLNNLDLAGLLNNYQELLLTTSNQIKDENFLDNSSYFALSEIDEDLLKLGLWSCSSEKGLGGKEPSERVLDLAKQRKEAREIKDYAKTDELRAQILTAGWQIDDYPWGYGLWWRGGVK